MNKKLLSIALGLICALNALKADEGMWPLHMIAKLQDKMQARGLKLTAEEIYSINNSSLKDGVVRLMTKQNRMFCTGEIISSEGLFLTNHHCGYGAIQELSTPADNILQNGFYAKSQIEERQASFNIGLLKKIEDVTAQVWAGTSLSDEEAGRAKKLSENLKSTNEALKNGLGLEKDNYVIEIVAFNSGNSYMAMYYEVYRDIRLVGTPPENIGKFGGETDNWRWPRHTCDFSMFRIYSNAENKPADYAVGNKTYTPAHFFPVSLQGVKEGDYAMTLGYPGRTTRYTYSEGIKYLGNRERPMRVQVRRDIMDVYEEYMKMDPKVRLMYSDKLAGIGNYWNKFNGEAVDLARPGIYENRKATEAEFERWVRANNKGATYGEVTALYDESYAKLNKMGMYGVYLQDGIFSSQPMAMAIQTSGLAALLADKSKKADAKTTAADMLAGADEAFKEFYEPIEQRVLASVLRHLYEDLDRTYLPKELLTAVEKYKRNYDRLSKDLMAKSIFGNVERYKKFMKKPSLGKLKGDPIYKIAVGYLNKYNAEVVPVIIEVNGKLARANRLFLAAQAEMNPDAIVAPDANGTMRLSYGRIMDMEPRDGVHYNEFTTSRGVLEKYKAGDFEFDAPVGLINLMKNKDFGQYAAADGELHTCFLSDNDITGGNSGSPVLNGKGELVGIAFDGNWEAISSDFAFIPDLQRTISVDIRYVLFIIDKLGGAKNIVDEMRLVK